MSYDELLKKKKITLDPWEFVSDKEREEHLIAVRKLYWIYWLTKDPLCEMYLNNLWKCEKENDYYKGKKYIEDYIKNIEKTIPAIEYEEKKEYNRNPKNPRCFMRYPLIYG